MTAAAVVVAAVGGAGGLLVAPHGLASLRLLELALGWWAAFAAHLAGLVALALHARGSGLDRRG